SVMAAAPEPGLLLGKLGHGRAEEFEVLRPAMGVGEALDDHERGAGMSVAEFSDGESAGRRDEAGHAQTDDPLGEGFRQLFEGRPLSQHLRTINRTTTPRREGRWLMTLAELVDRSHVGVSWPRSSNRGTSLLCSAESALDPD